MKEKSRVLTRKEENNDRSLLFRAAIIKGEGS